MTDDHKAATYMTALITMYFVAPAWLWGPSGLILSCVGLLCGLLLAATYMVCLAAVKAWRGDE